MRRAFAAVGAGALTLAACVACSSSSSPSSGSSGSAGGSLGTIRVVTSVPHAYQFLAVEAADALGTWSGTGLKVDVISGSTPTIGKIMAAGKADVALAGGTTEAANQISGLDTTIVAANLGPWDQKFIASSKLHATSVEALRGKNFGTTGAGSPGAYSVYKLAQRLGWKEGTDYKTTTLGNVSALIAALKSGSIDAFAWSDSVAFQLENSGVADVVGDASTYVGPNMLEAFSVSNSYAKSHKAALKVFFTKYFAMVKKLQADPALFAQTLVQQWQVPEKVAQELAKKSLPLLSADGTITQAELSGLADSVAFTTGKKTSAVPKINYQYWSTFVG